MAPTATVELMKQRIAAVPDALVETLYASDLTIDWTAPVIVTGLGSSQCAARLLAGLLTARCGIPALFVPMTDFYCGSHARGKTLVVFSQGLSANACIALARRQDYEHCVLVTSATEAGLQAAGKNAALELLRSLQAEGATLIRHPLEDEYTLLPRFIGPACALAAAIAMAQASAQEDDSLPNPAALREAFADAEVAGSNAQEWINDFAALPEWNFCGAAVEHCGNLQAKVMECLFMRLPHARDWLEFSHGAFQANCHQPSPQWLFTDTSAAQAKLLSQLKPLYEKNHYTLRIMRSPLGFPFNLLYYELFLNQLVLSAVEQQGLDLIEWPGKGRDGAGYSLSAPY
jgi:hypothetical protein